jgi:hypothetical protein
MRLQGNLFTHAEAQKDAENFTVWVEYSASSVPLRENDAVGFNS